jgi:hypothetical protein
VELALHEADDRGEWLAGKLLRDFRQLVEAQP